MVRCAQPAQVRNLDLAGRKEWWKHSKRLQSGALVCVINSAGSVLFCVVSSSTLRTKEDAEGRRAKVYDPNEDSAEAPKPAKDETLSQSPEYLHVALQLVDPGEIEIHRAMDWYCGQQGGFEMRYYVVEFPGVLLASFKHTLEGLQQMYTKPELPFVDLLAPSGNESSEAGMSPPLYARKAGFAFDMKCLAKRDLIMSVRSPIGPSELAAHSTLDSTQSAALLNTLQRGLSLIQGPPGTGKSYTGGKIIQVLLANKTKAQIGPILCVCFTNHALDQLLEYLLDDGVEQVIRIGSRSKSERLEDLKLSAVAGKMDRTKTEKHELWLAISSIKGLVEEMQGLLTQLSSAESWRAIKRFLSEQCPWHHNELFGETEDGWELVTGEPSKIVHKWLTGGRRHRSTRQLSHLKEAPLMSMSCEERRMLYGDWLRGIRNPIMAAIWDTHRRYNEAMERKARVRSDLDLRCIQQADVIGVTTTGLAQKLGLLRRLRSKVMVCEEAGEVLEGHVLTALLPSIEHVVLIGDHLQLRPQIQNFELQSTNPIGAQYSLDTSLFERLVQPSHANGFRAPVSVLETQRRMHPDISELVRSTLYPTLKDSETVARYPKVFGLKERLFWLHHEELEAAAASQDPLNKSHVNEFEVEMTTALVSHLVRQGKYLQGDIAVITPYLGQLQRLRRRMESMFEISVNERDAEELTVLDAETPSVKGAPSTLVQKSTLLRSVRVATVDNFQGEEAKVVVISLVRSNPQARCGFLSTSNRINVLLSRAQHGMYIIGNSNTCVNVPMWADVVEMLRSTSRIGTSLELQCPRHPDTPLAVSRPDHFAAVSPESGCNLACDKRLYCGHRCLGRCHSDVLHSAVKCLEPCPRSKASCEHPCPLTCGEKCQEKCHVRLENIDVALPCGHRLSSALCWQTQDPSSVRCTEKVTKTVPGCEHKVSVPCHEDVSAADFRCGAKCGAHQSCGHECQYPCFRCQTREDGAVKAQNHGICIVECGRKYTDCPHSCFKACHGDTPCPQCTRACEVRCSHSKCSKPCHEPCDPCAEKECQSGCPHAQCTMPCAAPCDWVPCSRRCAKTLDCGHQCPSLCGEPCPGTRYCQTCATPEVKSTCVDFIEMREYREIDLDEEPCIFPDCGHFLVVSSMDGQMDMSAFYRMDANGVPIQVQGLNEPFSAETGSGVKLCANCRGSLRSISRYGRIIRRAMLDEATKKFITWSHTERLALAQSLAAGQERLEKTPAPKTLASADRDSRLTSITGRLSLLEFLERLVGGARYGSMIKLWRRIKAHADKVRKEEQPFHRVADLVRHANREQRTAGTFTYDESVIQVGGYLAATALLLKCDIVILSDFLMVRKAQTAYMEIAVDMSTYRADLQALIELAREAVRPKEEAQGHIFAAQLGGLCLALFSAALGSSTKPEATAAESLEELKKEALNHVAQARGLFDRYPSTRCFEKEADSAEELVNGGAYHPVTAEELRAVYKAMAVEFRGTGHWYTCANGHPFTIGECGRPMQLARCPECDAPIGGRNHSAAQGVQRAAEMEGLAQDFGGVQL